MLRLASVRADERCGEENMANFPGARERQEAGVDESFLLQSYEKLFDFFFLFTPGCLLNNRQTQKKITKNF